MNVYIYIYMYIHIIYTHTRTTYMRVFSAAVQGVEVQGGRVAASRAALLQVCISLSLLYIYMDISLYIHI